ncbi:MAG: DMT family transporter [Methanobacteriota archaeon]
MNLLPIILALSTAFFWVFGQVLGKVVLRDLNATTVNAISFFFNTIALTAIVLVTGLGPTETWPIFLAIASGALGLFAALQIYFYTMKRAPAHIVVPIGNSASVWAVILALFLLGEKITVISPISLAVVVGGALLFFPIRKESKKWRLAVPLALSAAVLWGLNMVINKSVVSLGMNSLTFIWIATASAAVFFILTSGVTQSWKGLHFNSKNVGLCIASGLSNNVIAFLFYFAALRLENVSSLAPFIATTIPIGFLLSILIARERPSFKPIIGMVLVFLGVLLASIW